MADKRHGVPVELISMIAVIDRGFSPAGMKLRYVWLVNLRSKSARAACTSVGFEKSAFGATTMSFWPMLMPAEAAACQVCAATLGTKVAVFRPIMDRSPTRELVVRRDWYFSRVRFEAVQNGLHFPNF